jgi:hypothetical protein
VSGCSSSNEIAIRSFEENLALCLLLGLPHNYSDRPGRQKAAAAAAFVRCKSQVLQQVRLEQARTELLRPGRNRIGGTDRR